MTSADTSARDIDIGLALLARMTTLFESASDLDATVRAAAEIAVPDFGDYCTIDLLSSAGRLERVAIAHSSHPIWPELLLAVRERVGDAMALPESPFAEVLRTRRIVLLPELTEEFQQRNAYCPTHLALTRQMSPISAIFCPLIARDELLGVVQICSIEGRRTYDEEAATIASAVAQRLALAIYNARLLADRERELAERRAMEQSLRASDQLLRTLIDASPDLIYARDREGRTIIANRAGAEILGREREELLGRVLDDFVPPEAAQRIADADERVIRIGEPVSLERNYTLPDGAREFHTVKAPLRDERGVVFGVVSVSRDVTERNIARSEIIDRERRVSLVLDSAPSGLILFRNEGNGCFRCVELNTQLTITTGLPRKALIGRLFEDVAPPQLRDEALRALDRAVTSKQRVQLPAAEIIVAGEPRLLESSMTPILGIDESLTHILVNTHDVTKRERALRALAESEARYRVLFSASPVPMWVYARDSLQILEVNDAAIEKYGWSREEFVKLTMLDLRRPEDVHLFTQRLPDRDSAQVLVTASRHRKRDGSLIDVEVYGAQFLYQGIEARLVYAIDVTAKRQLAAQLLQSQKTEAVGRLAGGIAHDFNNILTVISGFAQVARARLETGEDVRDELEQVMRASDRAASLTRQLLAYSRKQVLQPEQLDLNDVVREAARMLHRLIGEDIQIDISLAPGVLTTFVDQAQMHTVLVNLALNARDAMPTGGALRITTSSVQRSREPNEAPTSYVSLAVSDTGKGIDEASRARLFEPFFTTKEVGKGTGLGLATVYGFVTQSGGTIEVESTPGVGSTFTVYLPQRERVPSPPNDQALEPDTRTTSGVVLVAEDDALVRELSTRFLQRGGYNVHAAESGERALELAAHLGTIDILVADVIMPGMSGRELADRLLAAHPSLRVLFVSGYTADIVSRHGVLDQGVSLLEKPFSSTELLEAVGRLGTPARR